jgi:glycosyltransferase involved in cell wall biosynthesis
MISFENNTQKSLFGDLYDYQLSWNSDFVFDAQVIVVMLVHNNGIEVSRAIKSVLGQTGTTRFSLLIVDDTDSADWKCYCQELLDDDRIVLATVSSCSVAQARNLALQIVKSEFTKSSWVSRLDADDELAHPCVLDEIIAELDQCAENVCWALAGNTLESDGLELK